MQITYDKKADAMYIYFQRGAKVAKTVELAGLLIADLDKEGKVIGVEIISASCQIKNNVIKKIPGLLNFSVPLPV